MKIMWFCIPAYGHTNPTLEVVRALTLRGHTVRYYSFEAFHERIEEAGAVFVPCDAYLAPVNDKEEKRLRMASTTEMSIQAFQATARMDALLGKDVQDFQPDLIVSDSVCFWGKLTAEKYHLPLIVSTTTFAFNQYASKYMKYSLSEWADMILGVPKMNRALHTLDPFGYHVKSALDIVQSKNDTDTIVYTSEQFQPFAETFDRAHYRFVGPSVREVPITRNQNPRPFIYISLGTVINDHPDFYRNCLEALRNEPVDVLISCGKALDPHVLRPIPANACVEQYVDQMQVLAKTDLFLTHCGMNSASEGLYMGVPELLFPLTGEQQAVAQRVKEVGAGEILTPKQAKSPDAIRQAIQAILQNESYRTKAMAMRDDFHQCGGAKAAADFIEQRLASLSFA